MAFPERYALSTKAPDRSKEPKAIHPNIILVFRFLITALLCCLSLITLVISILVVKYYEDHKPIVFPSWGSLIYLIILSVLTPIIYFGYNIAMPLAPFINYGDFLYGLFRVKVELLLQFTMCVLWVSGAMAYYEDLGGYQNCQFDGYFHYPKPMDFQHVCYLRQLIVALAFATFGVQVFLWASEMLIALYIFLFLDQESLSEPHFSWGRRAYDFQQGRHVSQQQGNSRSARVARASVVNSEDDPERISQTGRRSGGGRRGVAYSNADMAESQTSLPASLGSRGLQAYTDGEIQGRAGDEEGGWHLRE
ncbi:hypothetical protein K437DRAFT_266706 [Tilletiaria anomala UBC 951]|uniref:MARVEL domain-containing protein n=1 Tax=Tilletiaria anomala (strain ATCC 24038 / CBS 436.72 / UBC 951) TaxID=1037660 RepID=A0A066WN05_TILAU|nr:uncharacterized protein K437DRAFT_266706 [Tilletiaria anomala UBC 951]KDN52344.1 hypothetical protein K437DRAFT_266706 [Tilletiaria anomala UBC 951]